MTIADIADGIAIEMEKENVEFYDENDFLDAQCYKKIAMYYSGWECDTSSWVMNDGTIFTTNHGSLSIMTREEFNAYRTQMNKVAEELDYLDDEIARLIKDNQ